MKEYLKEGLIVFALTLILTFLIEFFPEPETITKEFIYSPAVMLAGIIALLLPLIASIPGGYLISKKNKGIKTCFAGSCNCNGFSRLYFNFLFCYSDFCCK